MSFCGHIDEFVDISVDRFDGANLESTAYFLTHCDTDNMAGIGLRTQQFLDRLDQYPDIKLYCSLVTSLVLKRNGFSSVSHKIVGLPIGPENHIWVTEKEDGCVKMLTVTLIPSGYCPGSVMFLFEANWKSVVYTGNFRLTAAQHARNMHPFYDIQQKKDITKAYLDIKFLGLYGTKFGHFPTRKESSDEVAKLACDWLKINKNHIVHLFISEQDGYAHLIMDVATKLRTRVRVPDDDYELYSAIPEMSSSISNKPCARIQVFRQRPSDIPESDENTNTHVLRIEAGTLWWLGSQSENLTISKANENGKCQHVMYSSHSSPQEIGSFIRFLRPDSIAPCVMPVNLTDCKLKSILEEIQK